MIIRHRATKIGSEINEVINLNKGSLIHTIRQEQKSSIGEELALRQANEPHCN